MGPRRGPVHGGAERGVQIFNIVVTTRALALTIIAVLAVTAGPETAASDNGTLLDFLSRRPHVAADSMDAMPAINEMGPPYADALSALAQGRRADAVQAASDAGYQVRDLAAGGRSFAVLMETTGNGIGPVVVVAKAPVRNVIIEVPHGVVDRGTDKQGAVLMIELGARALILAGANRCAAREASPCSGKTGVCGGGRRAYRLSDTAHNDQTLFHVAHRVLSRAWPDAVVLQPHGFKGKNGKTNVIVSDGSADRNRGDGTLAGRLRDTLAAAVGKPGWAVHCQNRDDDKHKYRRLCATTNVQGRDLNGSADACRVPATAASGRFLHVEQSAAVRRGFVDDWHNLDKIPESAALLEALRKVLPCLEAGCAGR